MSGHPLDLIKVRLQTQDILLPNNKTITINNNNNNTNTNIKHTAKFTGGWDVFKTTLKYEGVSALYKGLTAPLLTVPLLNAVVFASYEQARRTILYYSNTTTSTTTSTSTTSATPIKTLDDLTLMQIGLAGAWAGFANSFICSPVELIKARLQVQYEGMTQREKVETHSNNTHTRTQQ